MLRGSGTVQVSFMCLNQTQSGVIVVYVCVLCY